MFDMDEFVAACRTAIDETDAQLAVREVVERAVSTPSEVEATMGAADSWGIDVLYNDDHMTILHFVWPPTLELFPTSTRCGRRSGSTAASRTTRTTDGQASRSR